ncbi:SusD/RagB family nutrient-binding outer membrane lipoprotein [Winogradskyella sp.]|uniref:SusD/RagB family nutrient-binding outer membrane lipoprotein n=1 Tax=Winogradskyella sp. TaxID=1883156 RepID=UPI003AA91475
MKNITKIKALVLFTVFATFTACDTVDFGDTNISPNAPTKASTALLLTNVERSVAGYTTQVIPNLYAQYISEGQYPESSQYQDQNFSYSGVYGILTEIKRIVELNTNDETKTDAAANGPNANQIAAASLLRVYYLKYSVERWGMMPYSEALEGLANPYPKFDGQVDIYKALIGEIDAALALITAGDISGDYLFDGKMATWAKFGNTMKMIMALNLSRADAATGAAKFNEALGNTISSNAENLVYPFLSDDANDNAWQDRFQTRVDYLISDTFANALIGAGTSTAPQDPRLPKMAATAKDTPTEYVGAPYGAQNTALNTYSFITSDIIYDGSRDMPIFTYAQVLFSRAEAAALGWTTETAATLYTQGIQASMEQWGVAAADIATYVAAKPYVNSSSIAYEKWVSMFLQGYDSWTDWRRMKAHGYEKPLTPPATILGGATGVPNRHAYATNTANLNKDNYDAAIAIQGADDLNTVLEMFK